MPQTVEQHSFDGPTVEVAMYISQRFTDRAGRTPVDTAIEYLSGAFDMAEVNYVIHYDLPAQDVPERSGGACDDQQFPEWNQRVMDRTLPVIAKDANVLLIDEAGGGCTNAPLRDPNRMTVGCSAFDTYRPYELESSNGPDDPFFDSVNSFLHEFHHALGWFDRPGEHGGYGFNLDGRWHRTPGVGANDSDNLCGEALEARNSQATWKYAFFHWCAVTHFRILDLENTEGSLDEPGREMEGVAYHTPSPPSTYPPRLNGETVQAADHFPRVPRAMDYARFTTDGEGNDEAFVEGGENAVSGEFTVANTNKTDPVSIDVTLAAETSEETKTVQVPPNSIVGPKTIELSLNLRSTSTVNACLEITDARFV